MFKSIFVLFAIVALVFADTDPCGRIIADEFYTFEHAKNCLNSISYNKEHAADQIESALSILDLYAFTEYLAHPPKWCEDTKVVMQDEFHKLSKKLDTIKSDYEFQYAFFNTMNHVRDLHTRYHMPAYAAAFLRTLPFTFVVRYDENNEDVYVEAQKFIPTPTLAGITQEELNTRYNKLTGEDLPPILGRTIEKINGMIPFEWMHHWANEGVNMPIRTPAGRLNYAAYYTASRGALNGLANNFNDTEDYVIVTVDGTDYELHRFAIALGDFEGTKGLEHFGEAPASKSAHNAHFESMSDASDIHNAHHEFILSTYNKASESTADDDVIVDLRYKSAEFMLNIVESKSGRFPRTCVLKVDTYFPSEFARWTHDLVATARMMKDSRCDVDGTKTIIDVRDNPGGSTTLVQALWSVFFNRDDTTPTKNLWPAHIGRTAYRDTELMRKLHNDREVEWDALTYTEWDMKPIDPYSHIVERTFADGAKAKFTAPTWLRDEFMTPYSVEDTEAELEELVSESADMADGFRFVLENIRDVDFKLQFNNQDISVLVGPQSASGAAFTASRVYDANFGKVVGIGGYGHSKNVNMKNDGFGQLGLVPGGDTGNISADKYIKPMYRGATLNFSNFIALSAISRFNGDDVDGSVYGYEFLERIYHDVLEIYPSLTPVDGLMSGTRGDIVNVVEMYNRHGIWKKCFENQVDEQPNSRHRIEGHPCENGKFNKEKIVFVECEYSYKYDRKNDACVKVDIAYAGESKKTETKSTKSHWVIPTIILVISVIGWIAVLSRRSQPMHFEGEKRPLHA